MRTGAMAAAVLNSAKVDLGPWDPGKDLVSDGRLSRGKGPLGSRKKTKQWGKERQVGAQVFFGREKNHGEICWLKLFDVVFLICLHDSSSMQP